MTANKTARLKILFALMVVTLVGCSKTEKQSNQTENDVTQASVSKTAEQSELKDGDFIVAEPIRSPLRVRENTKYWNCSGLVNTKLINRTFNDLIEISKNNDLDSPDIETCTYIIENIEAGGRTGQMVMLDFYTSAAEREKCWVNNGCGNWREAHLTTIGGGFKFSYNLSNSDGTRTYGACNDLNGNIISGNKNCMEYYK